MRRRKSASSAVARAKTSVSSFERAAFEPAPPVDASWSTSASMSRMVSDGVSACGTSTLTTVRQPTPMRPCLGAPVSIATAIGTSSPSSRASRSASDVILAERADVDVTAVDVATSSANSIVASLPPGRYSRRLRDDGLRHDDDARTARSRHATSASGPSIRGAASTAARSWRKRCELRLPPSTRTYRVHSLHAYFIRRGDHDEPIRFEVDRIRNGRSFATRTRGGAPVGRRHLQHVGQLPGRRARARRADRADA